MRTLTIMAAALTASGAFVASVPAMAERNWGQSQQNGQCWNSRVGNSGSNAGTWGYWSTCPQKASAVVAPSPNRRARRQGSR
jgi:hypothetical protein